ncbi:DUF805 domain-containing protein [Sphingobacterium sp. SRCM116780]|uniref:DUF805 domain-containing protein n=1 Tax=Sphingobacterium sp. SRCM116780 TaxID=2907623 RepID=UPI001F313CC1|nr:DUF805 domain-containing protein [Sphingobacterium sp. SRCM116780]UIR55702.1 DUF805 domain-containing protein [Sphingobacterium sp. SRCM116780]
MELKEAFLKVVRDNYANFDGRARRKEYWMFFLSYMIVYLAIIIVAAILSSISSTLGGLVYGILSLASLAILVPSLAVAVRRLHDTNKSGWFLLLTLIPLAGFYVIYLLVIEGDRGPNEYGEDPKGGENSGNPFTNNNPFGQVGNNNPFGNQNNENTPPPPPSL